MTNTSGRMINASAWEEVPEEDLVYSLKIIYSRGVALRRRHSTMIFYLQVKISNAHRSKFGALIDSLYIVTFRSHN